MFRAFATVLGLKDGNPNLFLLHPADLSAALELAWDRRFDASAVELGRPLHRSDLIRFGDTWFGRRALTPPPAPPPGGVPLPVQPLLDVLVGRSSKGVFWDHLIYAYMIENTRVYEVFRRVIHEFLHGEKLGAARVETQHWLRSTEELFYREPAPFLVTAVNGYIRPDLEATRRNAYQRLFGMDLNSGTADNKPYPYVRAESGNKEFVSTFEELLREVWIGIVNANNSSGPKATDDAKLADLTKKLSDMLLARRVNGTLSREEFAFVSMMSWFHLTLATNSAIVVDLRAQAESEEQRLYKIAQQVGVPAHGLANSYFEISDSISRILLLIESGVFAQLPNAVQALYTPGTAAEKYMRTIITHWSVISGRDMKAAKIAPLDTPRRPA